MPYIRDSTVTASLTLSGNHWPYCLGNPPWQLMDDQIWDMYMLGPTLELQSSEVWSHAVRAHHWIEKYNHLLGTQEAMYWIVPSNLCLMLTLLWPNTNGTNTWTLIRIFGSGEGHGEFLSPGVHPDELKILSRCEFQLLKVLSIPDGATLKWPVGNSSSLESTQMSQSSR